MNESVAPRPTPPAPADQRAGRFELLISALLRAGVAVSLTLVVAGTLLSFVHHPEYASSKTEVARLVRHENGFEHVFPHTLSGTLRGIADLQGRAFVVAGLLVLIATPVMRVALSVFTFVAQRDTPFAMITTAVLALLLLSFILGRVES